MDRLEITLPDDFHVHLRQGPGLAAYASRSASRFGRLLVMPNVVPPLVSSRALDDYRKAVEAAIRSSPNASTVLSTFKLIPGMGADAVMDCVRAGAVAAKYYPAGATTNAQDGVPDPTVIAEELAAVERAGLVLCVHAEDPAAPVMEREEAFIPVLDGIIGRYPRLRVVMEHLSSVAAVDAVLRWPGRVAATITAHHLAFTVDDLLGERLSVGFFCKPVLKTARDREALVSAATSGSPKFFFGSDSAPHSPAAKAAGAAGCYTSPLALELLAGVFDEAGALDRLEGFVSLAGAGFYGLSPNEGRLRLWRSDWTVPALLDGVEPLAAGRMLVWMAERLP